MLLEGDSSTEGDMKEAARVGGAKILSVPNRGSMCTVSQRISDRRPLKLGVETLGSDASDAGNGVLIHSHSSLGALDPPPGSD